jgi:hypothetical protein
MFVGVLADTALAQNAPLVRTIASHFIMLANDQLGYRLQCPGGYIPTGYALSPQYPYDWNTEMTRDLIDSNKATINRTALSSASPLMGGGYSVSIYNEEHHQHDIEAKVTCLAAAATTDNAVTLVRASVTVAKLSSGSVISFCPPDSPVALGGFSNADGRALLVDAGSAPVWGTSSNPVSLADLPDGQTGPPTGWQIKVYNSNFFATAEATVFGLCGKAPGLQAFIYSVPVPQAAFKVKTPFSIFAPVPDGWTAVGSGFDGGQYAEYFASDLWMQDGIVVDMLQWYPSSKGYDSGTAEVRAFMTRGLGDAPSGGARAAMAVLAVPNPAAAPTTVSIVEFYHAELDHYFITAIPQEIADLDSGVHPGWARTGQTFKAYGAGSSGRTGRRPVCRAYGNPQAGLNSHFYSASPDECAATMVIGYGYAWGLEASEVFQMDLPDPVTGACPAGGVPIYRTFNQRKDANHRYTTSIAIRDQMVARGGIAEGYGPTAVTLCGLP